MKSPIRLVLGLLCGIVFVFFAAPALADDNWPMFRGNPSLTGVAKSKLPDKLRVRWRFDAKEGIASSAAIVDGMVYVGCDAGFLYAIDLKTGKEKWKFSTNQAPIESSPTVLDGMVFFGDDDGVMHALDAKKGTEKWKYQTQSQIISSANHFGDWILFGSYDGHLYCLDRRDGKLIWKYETEDRVHATPGIANGHALVAGCDSRLHVVNVKDGKAAGHVELDSVTGASAAARGSLCFLATYASEVLAIDIATKKIVWRFKDEQRELPFLSSAALTDELAIVGGRDKRVHAIELKTGKQRWQFSTKGRIDSSPVVAGKRVFIGSEDGNLYALEIATGKELWRFEAGDGISASPAIGQGCLVIGTHGGALYCFSE